MKRNLRTMLVCLAVLHVTATKADAQTSQMPVFVLRALEGADYTLVDMFPLGAATLDLEGDCPDCTLTVGNIGTSGQDGVEFDLRLPGLQTLATFMDWQWWDPDDSLPVGAVFQSELLATIDGVPNQPYGTWRMEKVFITSTQTGYASTLELAPLVVSERGHVFQIEVDGVTLAQFQEVSGAIEMQVDFDAPDSGEPFQQAWVFEEETDSTGAEVKRWDFINGWPSKLSEVGLRSDGELVQAVSTDPSKPVTMTESITLNFEPIKVEVTTLRLTFANVPEFQVDGLQLFVVPEPSSVALLAMGLFGVGHLRLRHGQCGR